jgi:hypothetical protein
MNKFFDINKMKRDICLPKFLEDNGFQYIRAKSSRRQLCYRSGDETLIVYKNKNEHWVYFDVHQPIRHFSPDKDIQSTTGKTIFDFIMNDQHVDFKKSMELADQYLQTGLYTSGDYDFVKAKKNLSPDYLQKISAKFTPAETSPACLSYFVHRGLNPALLQSPLCKGHLGEWTASFDDQPNKKTVGAQMRTQDGNVACLLSSAIDRKTFVLGNRSESLWYMFDIENRDKDKPFQKAFIAESWQDAFAHYQLNQQSINSKDVLYMSCQGNLTDAQTAFVRRLLNDNKIASLTTIFDNDIMGYQYTAKILNDCYGKNVQFELLSDKKNDTVDCYFKNIGISEKEFQAFLESFKETTVNGKTAQCTLPVASFKEVIKTLSEQLKVSNFSVEYPQTKDFNDDLKQKHNINTNINY